MLKKTMAKIYFRFLSRKYHHQSGLTLDYMFKKSKSRDHLVVIFNAFPRPGLPATYNYIKTTDEVDADRLFILDNFGHNKIAGYYLLDYGDSALEDAVTELVSKKMKERNYKKIIFIGTSKGGYAAMYYAVKLGADAVIAGAPQYLLGNYLTDIPQKANTFKGIAGDPPVYTVDQLNQILPDRIKSKPEKKPIFYVHYSDKEHTYWEHISFLLDDLEEEGYELHRDREEYEEHGEVAKFFPQFLVKTLNDLTSDKK